MPSVHASRPPRVRPKLPSSGSWAHLQRRVCIFLDSYCATILNVYYCAELNCKLSHLALAWLTTKSHTSTVILGASKPEQVLDNLKALEVIPKLTPEILEKLDKILDNKPSPVVSHLSSHCARVVVLIPCLRTCSVVIPWKATGREPNRSNTPCETLIF